MKNLLSLSIRELQEGLKNKIFSSVDIVSECYRNIERINHLINAFITVIPKEKALGLAKKYDLMGYNSPLPLQGLPYAVKDSYLTKGIRTTCGSKILEDFIPPYNATVIERLNKAGAILIGKTSQDAWGHGASSENTDFKPALNPWDKERVAGGSSGGSASAVATRCVVFSIGEDTGGSIRNPAAWCNVTGLKVTYGRVSRYGCIAYASSFDTMGPMGKTVEDCAAVLKVIAGKDPYDATSSPEEVPDFLSEIKKPIKKRVLGIPQGLLKKGIDREIKNAIERAVERFKELGLILKKVDLPLLDYGVAAYYIIAPSETSSNLARYDGIRYGGGRENFTKETIRRIMVGTYALSAGYYDAFYKKAQQVRTLFIRGYRELFAGCDAVIMPVTPILPTRLGELINDPLKNMLADYFTCQTPVGIPALALPCGFTKLGLPIGMQILGKMFSEPLLLNLGYHYQQITDWHKHQPEI